MKVTEDSETYAVIAPNMCKQIVAFQATMEHMAKAYPGAFGGYKMELVESHQSTKADTSGDPARLEKLTKDSETYAVIAPNMCKQIVAFQATMENMAKQYPG